MEGPYIVGCLLAAVLVAGRLWLGFLSRRSAFHTNMTTAGFTRSWVSGEYIERNEAWPVTSFVFGVLFAVVSVLLSWLTVGAMVVGAYWQLAVIYDQRSAPAAFRELSWRYSYVALPLADLMRLDQELARARLGRQLSSLEMGELRDGYERRLGAQRVQDAIRIASEQL